MADPDQLSQTDNILPEVTPEQWLLQSRRAPTMQAVNALEDDPEEAAESDRLGQSIGVPGSIVKNDLEEYQRQHKAALTSELFNNNEFLREYVRQHPLGASVSNDDWGQLDAFTRAVQKIHQGPLGAPSSVMDKAIEGFVKHFGTEGPGSYFPSSPVERLQHPEMEALAAVVALAGTVPEMTIRTMSGLIGGAAAGGTELYRQLTGRDASGQVENFLQMAGDPGFWASVGLPVEEMTKVLDANKKLKEEIAAVAPHIMAGKPVPVGASKVIDQLHAEQAKLDLKNLDEAKKEADASATRERSAELMTNLGKIVTDQKIGFTPELVRKLYGGKEGEPIEFDPEDGKLGFIKDLQQQLTLAEAHGGDIEAPIADVMAKMDPEAYQELREGIRVRPGGMTLEETKEAGKPVELEEPQEGQGPPPPVTPEETLRKSAGLEPLFGRPSKLEQAEPENFGIVPESLKPEAGKYNLDEFELSPYANFPLREGLKQIDPTGLDDTTKAMHAFFSHRLNELVGDVPVRIMDHQEMNRYGKEVHGFATAGVYAPKLHEIFVSDEVIGGGYGHQAAVQLLLHEGEHALTHDAIEKYPEIKADIRALMDDAITKSGLSEKEYGFTDEHEFMSEAATNPDFLRDLHATPISRMTAEKIGLAPATKRNLFDGFRLILKKIFARAFKVPIEEIPESILDGFLHVQEKIEKILKEGKPEGVESARQGAPAKTPEDAERDLFTKANAIGMTKADYEKYMKGIAEQREENAEYQSRQAAKDEAKRQSQEWKDNYPRVREEVKADLRNRPDLAADRLLREGDLHGQKVQRPALDAAALSPEQKALLPEGYARAGGVSPDVVAGLFGYQSGDSLVSALGRLKQERELEGLTPAAHFSKLVDVETERKMKQEYGRSSEDIFTDAKEQALSPGTMELLHQDMLNLANQAGHEGPISKEVMQRGARELFNGQTLGSHSSDKYLAAAGRTDLKIKTALLDGDKAEAFRLSQQRMVSALLAKEALKLEKERASFEKFAKTNSKREITARPAEYTNWIHDILMRTGNVVRRSVQDLQEAIGRETHDTLEKFVTDKNTNSAIWEQDENAPSDFQVMPVAPFLFNKDYRTTLDAMTPGEFKAVFNSLKTLDKNAREDQKILVSGEKRGLAETLEKMTSQIGSLFEGKEKQYAFGHKDQGVGHALRTYWASLLQIESIFNRFDRGDPKGIFRKVISQPIFEGSHELHTLETKYSRLYKTLDFPDKGEMKKLVENPLFGDPLYDGEKRPLTKGNLLAILQNVGNPSQLDKLARGYKIENKDSIMQWLFANTKKEDWDRAQKLGDIFEQAFEHSAQMYHSLSGVAPEKIDIRPIQTPFGEYKGWYHPVIYDPLRPGTSKKLMGQNPLEDGSYYRVATPSGYTKARTGYAAPIALSFDAIPFKLKSMLNDIAMRPAVTEAAKVFYDPKFQMAVTKYYSKEIKDLLLPYLKDVAGQKQYKDAAQSTAQRYLEYARQNVTATLIGLNPSTVMKHGPTAAMLSIKEVGAQNFLRELTGLLSMSDDLGERNWKFAMKGGLIDGEEWHGSEELQRRQRNWQETLSGAQADLFGENTLRNTVIKLGATPVAISDLLSAVPTWLASYKQQIRAGEQHGDAVQFADTAVRRAHGSSAVAARPRIMRGGALAQFATPFYTFFNEMFQRQYEMAWRAKDAIEGRSLEQERSGEYKAGLKEVPNLVKGLWAFVVFPALVEQLVSPVLTGQEPEAVKLGAWGMRTIMSSLPGFRDLAEAFIGGRDPTVGLYSTAAKMLTDTFKDVSKGEVSFNKAHAGKTLKHTITAFGAVSGLTNAQEGRTAEFVYDYATGKQRPRDISELLKGLYHGQIKEQRR